LAHRSTLLKINLIGGVYGADAIAGSVWELMMTYAQYDDFPYWAEIKVNGDAVTLRKVMIKIRVREGTCWHETAEEDRGI
jgi:hypothetical protein